MNFIDVEKPSLYSPLIFNNKVDISNIKNLLLIDSIVSESNLFYTSSNSNTFPIIYSYNSNRDDLNKLLDDKFSNGLERIAFVFHDNIKDGKTFLNQELFFLEDGNTFSPNTQLLIDIIKKFGVKNVDFLACNSLNYPNWVRFYNLLTKETGVIVGASNNLTGNLKNGGDWIMESTNENVVSTYFNTNIKNYASTLASTITQNGGTIYIQEDPVTNIIQYQSNSTTGTWIPFTSFPITIVNSNPVSSNILTISLFTNITIVISTGYFICGSSYITFDGDGNTVTIGSVPNYPGLINNGTSFANGYPNITVQNINNVISGISKIETFGGWICQSYFGSGVIDVVITKCSNSGVIGVTGILAGGICGAYAATNGGNISISNCSNSGVINSNSGGICGSFAANNGGTVTISNCSNSGEVISSGGICGALVGNNEGTVSIINCSNTGNITRDDSGGICGIQGGNNKGSLSIINCSNTGDISGNNAGGICGNSAGYVDGKVSISNCLNTGVINGSYTGGIIGSRAGVNGGNISITNSVNIGIISGQYAGGITGFYLGINSNNLCSLINCYNIGNIAGSNAGGITGADVGFNDSVEYNPKVLIQNCYSLGNIGTTGGGICGGTEGSTYTNTPIVNITNCYTSYNSIVDSGSEYVSTSLPTTIRNSIISLLTNVYTSLISLWSNTDASTSLTGTPTYSSNTLTNPVGKVWADVSSNAINKTKINIPWLLGSFNAQLYNPATDSTINQIYTSKPGILTGILYSTFFANTTASVICDSNTGVLTFTNLADGDNIVNVIGYTGVSGTNPNIYYGYNLNTFTINAKLISPIINKTNNKRNNKNNIKPLIYSQPYSQIAKLGTTVIFSVFIFSLSSVTYQWFFNNLPIKNATNSNYIIDTVKEKNIGKYFVIVTNNNGSTRSDNAYLLY